MELTIRHLSGSRAGQAQTLDLESIVLGRNPSSTIAFDPEKDLSVSGRHAEVVLRHGAWVIHDLGSSNGTYIGGERITERALRPGEIVQLGKNGPQVQFDFRPEQELPPEPTVVVSEADEIPMEGRTVAMMVSGAAQPVVAHGIQAPPPPALTRPKKKKSPLAVILLALAGVVALLVLAFAGIIFLGARSARQQAAAKAQVEDQKLQEANQIRQKIAEQREAASAAEEQLRQAQATSTTGTIPGGTSEAADMQRQLQESQRMIDELTKQLQTKNDEITAVRTKPVAPPRTGVTPSTRVKPPAARGQQTASGAKTTQPPAATVTPPASLVKGKQLKKVIAVRGLPPEIPPAELPDETAGELAGMVGRSLMAMGTYSVSDRGLASVSVTVTNFKNTKRTNVDLRSASETASRVGGLIGRGSNIPQTPVDVKNVSFDSAMSARVSLYDRAGRSLGETNPYSETKGTQSNVSLDPLGVRFSQLFGSDSPAGDVARDIVAQAVEAISQKIGSMEWTLPYTGEASAKGAQVNLDFGRSVGVEMDDAFAVTDKSGRQIATLRVRELGENDLKAEIIDGATRGSDLRVEYLGSFSPNVSKAQGQKSLKMRQKTDVYQGPGKSFKKAKTLGKGTRVKYLYAVGLWAKATDGSATFWVPLISAQIEG